MISEYRLRKIQELCDENGIELGLFETSTERTIKDAEKRSIENRRQWARYDYLIAEGLEEEARASLGTPTKEAFRDYYCSITETLADLEERGDGTEAEETLDHFLNLLVLLLKWDRDEKKENLERTLNKLIQALE